MNLMNSINEFLLLTVLAHHIDTTNKYWRSPDRIIKSQVNLLNSKTTSENLKAIHKVELNDNYHELKHQSYLPTRGRGVSTPKNRRNFAPANTDKFTQQQNELETPAQKSA